VPGIGQRVPQCTNHQATHIPGIAEADFRLGRVDIHVHIFGVQLHKQRRQRVAVPRQKILIGRADHAVQHPVFYRAAIDEQELHLRIAAVQRRQTGEPCQRHAFAFCLNGHGIVAEVPSHDGAKTGEAPGFALGLRHIAQHVAAIASPG
jgi:hypothetical protein